MHIGNRAVIIAGGVIEVFLRFEQFVKALLWRDVQHFMRLREKVCFLFEVQP
jgi:hypothetical protein